MVIRKIHVCRRGKHSVHVLVHVGIQCAQISCCHSVEWLLYERLLENIGYTIPVSSPFHSYL